MKKRIRYFLRTFDKNLPPEFTDGTLERVLQSVYSTHQRMVLPEYFKDGSNHSPKNPGFILISFYSWENQYGHGEIRIGAQVSTQEKVEVDIDNKAEDFEFTYIDKFGVVPKHQGNGEGDRLFNFARGLMADEGMNLPPQALLRTSIPEAHDWYSKRSDAQTVLLTENGQDYYFHGFGFYEKGTKKKLIPYADEKFQAAVVKAASKPITVIPIQSSNDEDLVSIMENCQRNGNQELG